MKHESGRSLIEVIGVLAIAGIMTAAAIAMYSVIRNNQTRKIASAQMEQMVSDAKLLMEMRGDYTGISVDYLIKAGALKSDAAPIGTNDWSIVATTNGAGFAINLTGLTKGECDYFTTAIPTWAAAILVNGFETDLGSQCFSSATNQISFIVQ